MKENTQTLRGRALPRFRPSGISALVAAICGLTALSNQANAQLCTVGKGSTVEAYLDVNTNGTYEAGTDEVLGIGSSVKAGDQILYRYTVSALQGQCAFSGGTITITTPDGNSVVAKTVTEKVCVGLSCDIGSVPSVTSDFVPYTVSTGDLDSSIFCPSQFQLLVATMTYSGGFAYNPGQFDGGQRQAISAFDTVCLDVEQPNFTVTKRCVADGPVGLISFAADIENTGNVELNVSSILNSINGAPGVSIDVPVGQEILAVGGTLTVSGTYEPPTGCSASDVITVTAVTALGTEVTKESNSVTCTAPGAGGLTVTIECVNAPVQAGDDLTYKVKIDNTGNVVVNNITVTINGSDSGEAPFSLAPADPVKEITVTVSTTEESCPSVPVTASATGTDLCEATVNSTEARAACQVICTPKTCISRTIGYWFNHVIPTRDDVQCVTLTAAFKAILDPDGNGDLEGNKIDLGFIQLPTDASPQTVAGAVSEALGLFWGKRSVSGDSLSRDPLCLARKRLAIQLIGATANVVFLNPENTECGIRDTETNTFYTGAQLLEAARTAAASCDLDAVQHFQGLLDEFNNAGDDLGFEGDLRACPVGRTNKNYISANKQDPTTKENCECGDE